MNGYLRQSTASQSRLIGPFSDDIDFKTAETGLTIANTDIKLRANGTTLANKNSGGGTHQANGMYSVTWDATDTANVGELAFSVLVAGALHVFGTYTVLEEAVYDAMFAASAPGYVADQPVNATKIGGTTQTGRDIGASVIAASVTADVGITQAGADKVWASTTRTLSSFGSLVADIAAAVWGAATRLLTAGTNIVLAKGTGITGFNDLSAAQVNSEVDTALADYDGPTHAEMATEIADADDAILVAIAALDEALIVRRGTVQGPGGFSAPFSTLILDAGASSQSNIYVPGIIFITGGAGAGQYRRIVGYDGSTKEVQVDTFWNVDPDNTSEFAILPDADVNNVSGNVIGSVMGNIIGSIGAVSNDAATTIANRTWEDDNSVRTTADSAGNKLRQALVLYEGN